MCLLLPLLVDLIGILCHNVLLTNLFTCLVLSLSNDLTFSINLLQRVSLLHLVPFHHCFTLRVVVLIIWDQVQSDIVQECSLMVLPQRRLIYFCAIGIVIGLTQGVATVPVDEVLFIFVRVKFLTL